MAAHRKLTLSPSNLSVSELVRLEIKEGGTVKVKKNIRIKKYIDLFSKIKHKIEKQINIC